MMCKTFLTILMLANLWLTACSAAAPRSGDVQPLPADVSTSTVAASTEAGHAQTPAENAPIIQFSANGGMAGFCDSLVVAADGAYTFARPCRNQALSGNLTGADLSSLASWAGTLADFQVSTEDNPNGPDNLATSLSFNGQGEVEADERQRRVILDWVTGLAVRLDAQQAGMSMPAEPFPAALEALCPGIPRPALVTADFENPNVLAIADPNSMTTCDVNLSRLPAGRITAADGNLFYPSYDPEVDKVVVLRISPDGEQTQLDFTEIAAEIQGPADFVVSNDGSALAWSQTAIDFEADPPV